MIIETEHLKNRRTWIAGIAATTLLAASLAACKQEQQGEKTGQALPVMVVSSQPIELEETYSASIRGRQDVDIIPQVSGRITRLCVKEGEQVAKGQVLAVIDQTPYQAALRIAIANVSAAHVFICYKTIAHRYHDCHIAKVYKNDQTAKLFWNIIYFIARKNGF